MKDHDPACAICGARPAPEGLRLPGLLSDLPPDRRGTLRHCPRPDCREAALARRARLLPPTPARPETAP